MTRFQEMAYELRRVIGQILGALAARVTYLWSLDWKRIAVDLLFGAAAAFLGLSRNATPDEDGVITLRIVVRPT